MQCVDALFALVISACASACAAPAAHGCALAGRTGMHAHNDYNHARPLLDALAAGAISVEADVYLERGRLLVGHDRPQLTAARSLEALYLAPLYARWRERGKLLPAQCGESLWLLIDVKADAETSYRALARLLERYRPMLTRVQDGVLQPGAVRVVISGERAKSSMARERELLAGYDGRVTEPEAGAPAGLVPLVSERWGQLFTWNGEGDMPAAERARLTSIAAEVHAQGRKLRFWATPDAPGLWRELLTAGVDLINTDSLETLQRFLREYAKTSQP